MTTTRILIVEDEAPIADLIRRFLTRSGYEVSAAVSTGEEALVQAARLSPDLALMDITLAGDLNGIQTAELLLGRFDIPVVFLSGLADDATIERSRDARAFGFVVKPFRQEDLKTSIDLALAKHADESRLRRVEQSLGAAIKSIADGVITADSRATVTFLNPAAESLTGWKLAEAVGQPLDDVFQAAPGAGRQAILRTHTGRETPIEYVAAPILNDSGVPAGRVLVFRDITQRRIAEEELNRSRDQFRSLAAHLQTVREEERARIAREVHDQLGQMLTGLRMDATWLVKRIQALPDPANREALASRMASMGALLDETVLTVRRIASELRPGALDDLGLAAALEWQAREWQARTGIECVVTCGQPSLNPSPESATALFRIFQETLTNVARHAKATRVTATLGAEGGALRLEICDNGRGISDEELRRTKSLGLVGMRERAAMLGGEFSIRGEPGSGTTVKVRLPLGSGE
jgi:two-component system sensor histidine kinase UhpB